jgi:hypothetical protein
MAGNRLKFVDFMHSRFFSADNATSRAADEIINTPDMHLLTQDEIFLAEGGYAGLAV